MWSKDNEIKPKKEISGYNPRCMLSKSTGKKAGSRRITIKTEIAIYYGVYKGTEIRGMENTATIHCMIWIQGSLPLCLSSLGVITINAAMVSLELGKHDLVLAFIRVHAMVDIFQERIPEL